jgi:Ni,Fe-hydrogenase I cytochrome b subunit
VGKLLMYFYLAVSVYCVVSGFLALYSHGFQHAVLSLFLAVFNFAMFSLFRKEGKLPKLKLIRGQKGELA